MPTGTLLGATCVTGGNNTLVATPKQGNYESQTINLTFTDAAAIAGIPEGANNTLIDASGMQYKCTVSHIDQPGLSVDCGVSS